MGSKIFILIERIFELIRKEEVVLWVGSGFSKYAGYPLAQELVNELYNTLSVSEQKEINISLLLPDFAEEFVRLKMGDRSHLNAVLKKAFLKKNNSIRWHSMISKIPHIKTIITTNYDSLFEIAFGKDCIKLVREADVAKIKNEIEIFKVHGDIGEVETIIITKSDYTKFFFNNTHENLYWNVISEKISNKSVVFIGYGFEDPNIFNVIEKVKQAVKENRKEVFLIAPNFPHSRITYLAQQGIQYIDFKGEVFTEKLYKNIKQNITSDFEKGFVGPETLRKFFLKNGLLVELEAFEERFKLKSVKGIDGNFNGQLSLELKKHTELYNKFIDFVAGKQFGEIEIDGKNLEAFKFTASEINLLTGDKNDFKFMFISKPTFEGIADIVFENNFEMSSLEYTVYSSKELTKIIAFYKNVQLVFTITLRWNKMNEMNLLYEQIENFPKTNDALNVLRGLRYLTGGVEFNIFLKHIKDKSYKFKFEKQDKFLNKISGALEYFELLKAIESLYKIQFLNIGNPTNEYYQRMQLVKEVAENKEFFIEWDEELRFDLDDPNASLELLLKMQNETTSFQAEATEIEEVEIHGQNINIGYKIIEYCEPYITNLEKVINDGERMVKVKSKKKQVKIRYSKISRAQ